MSNVFKTALLLAVLTVMLVLLGGAIGGRQGMVIAFILALLSGQALLKLFSTHPPMHERIARLRAMRLGR
jgi:Zn-dependent protease with chaperone function